jgi:predicted enzyme related to lactoylglutathione lyase
MVAIKAVAHFSILVSDIARSTRFYTEIVGRKHLSTVPRGIWPSSMRPGRVSSW